MTVWWTFSFLSTIISSGDSRGLQLYDYWSNRERSLSNWRSILYRLTYLQCLMACICFHSNVFDVFLHLCVYRSTNDDHFPADAFNAIRAAKWNWNSMSSRLPCLYDLRTCLDIYFTITLNWLIPLSSVYCLYANKVL